MKNVFTLALLALFGMASAQSGYWQQKVDYTMTIDFDAETHQFTGTQKLVYTNNSPDALHKVYYHLHLVFVEVLLFLYQNYHFVFVYIQDVFI